MKQVKSVKADDYKVEEEKEDLNKILSELLRKQNELDKRLKALLITGE